MANGDRSTYSDVADDFEESANDKWDKEVSLRSDHLIKVQGGNHDECDYEDDSSSHARIVAIQLEVAILSSRV